MSYLYWTHNKTYIIIRPFETSEHVFAFICRPINLYLCALLNYALKHNVERVIQKSYEDDLYNIVIYKPVRLKCRFEEVAIRICIVHDIVTVEG